MIKYFVRTTNERILDESFNRELKDNYDLLVDTNHNSGKAFFEQLDTINEYDCVVMEDDIILCKDFKNRIEDVINQYPDMIINFFTFPRNYFKTRKNKRFIFNQCTYYPKGMGSKIKNIILNTKRINPETSSQEKMVRFALLALNISHIQFRPCLVQHIDNGSLMWKNTEFAFRRRSPFFIDYLDELGISYDEAENELNQRKLWHALQADFKRRFKNND